MAVLIRSVLHGFKRGAHRFGAPISCLVNSALLLVVYLVAVGVTALVARITGKRFIETRTRAGTYWRKADTQMGEWWWRQF